MPPKLRSKIILESQDSVYDAVKASLEGLIPNMVKQFERNATKFLQEEYASDNLIGPEAGIGNVDMDTDESKSHPFLRPFFFMNI